VEAWWKGVYVLQNGEFNAVTDHLCSSAPTLTTWIWATCESKTLQIALNRARWDHKSVPGKEEQKTSYPEDLMPSSPQTRCLWDRGSSDL